MTDWTAGYVADVGYTFGYYTELNPLCLRLAFLNAGMAFPEVRTVGRVCLAGVKPAGAKHREGGQEAGDGRGEPGRTDRSGHHLRREATADLEGAGYCVIDEHAPADPHPATCPA